MLLLKGPCDSDAGQESTAKRDSSQGVCIQLSRRVHTYGDRLVAISNPRPPIIYAIGYLKQEKYNDVCRFSCSFHVRIPISGAIASGRPFGRVKH